MFAYRGELLLELYVDEALLCLRIGELDSCRDDDSSGVFWMAQSYVDEVPKSLDDDMLFQ